MYKKFLCVLLTAAIALSSVVTVRADKESDIRDRKSAAQEDLSETNAVLESLIEKQHEVQSEIDDINADIVDMIVQIDQAKEDIAKTEKLIEEKQAEIDETQLEIEDTQAKIVETEEESEITKANLAEAEARRDKQYADMKKRIQFIYENGGDIGWAAMLFNEKDIASFFNKAEYTEKLHEYDRQQLEAYIQTIHEIEDLEAQLEAEKAELEEAKAELEEEKARLEKQKAELEEQKEFYEAQKAALEEDERELENKLAEAKGQYADYEIRIETATEQARRIRSLISQYNAELERIAEEKRAAEEAARKAREAEEARRRAEEEAQKERDGLGANISGSRSNDDNDSSSSSGSSSSSSDSSSSSSSSSNRHDSSDEDLHNAGRANVSDYSNYEKYDGSNYTGSGVSGSDIVAYADRWLGNPYVWGGNSLTNGCDCSHFVYLVLKNCGAYSGGYRTSGEWPYAGKKVSSLSEARAGDVIVYSGHVAIYDGHGGIVEAKGEKWGICHDRSANYKTILAIRRFT